MRNLYDLIDKTDSAWPLVLAWFNGSNNPVELLPANKACAENTLLTLQVTTRSPLGAIAFETGGILIDHGWLKILGSGCERLPDNLMNWNGLGDAPFANLDGALVVAYDAVGGFFAINGGRFPGNSGNVFYFAPDSLEWEDLEIGFSDFVSWAASGDLAKFYQNARWFGWEKDVLTLSGDLVFSIYPPLWTKGEPVANRSRKPVPALELWNLYD